MGGHERRVFGAPGYHILERIGGSDGADVYLAEQKALGRRVALKVLHADGRQDPEQAARFEFETRTASELLHPNIVPLLDSGTTEDGHRWYAMPHLPGGDLSCRVVLPPGEVRRIALALCEALWYAHSRNVVHRDIKPTNVLFDDTGRPMLADFGIATSIFGRRGLTLPGKMLGSARYISPEQARGEKVDPRADLYSLGVVIYEMLTGHPPFDGADDVALARQHASAPVPRLPMPFGAWQGFFDRALAKQPSERFMSARTMAQALDLIEVPPPAKPVAPAAATAGVMPPVSAAPAAAVANGPVDDDLPQIRVEAPTYRDATREPMRRPPRWPFAVLAAGVLAIVALIAYALSDDAFSPLVPPQATPAASAPPTASPAPPATVAETPEAKPAAATPKPVAATPKPEAKPEAKPAPQPARAREPAAPAPAPDERDEDIVPEDDALADLPDEDAPGDADDPRGLDDESRYADDAGAGDPRDRDLGDDDFDTGEDAVARDETDRADPYEDDAPPPDDYDRAPDYRDDPALAPGNWSPPIGRLELDGPPRRQLAALDAHVDEARRWLEDERYRVDELAQTLPRRDAEQEYEEFAAQEQAFERWLDRMGALRDRIVGGE